MKYLRESSTISEYIKQIGVLLLVAVLMISMSAFLSEKSCAVEEPEEDPVVLEGENGQTVVITVEDEFTADEIETGDIPRLAENENNTGDTHITEGDTPAAGQNIIQDNGTPLAGQPGTEVEIEDTAPPLAGFDAVRFHAEDGKVIHLYWMILLLAAAIFYAAYFYQYQKKLLSLRRRTAEAEYQLRKEHDA